MSNQAENKDAIISKALRALIQQNQLTPEEISQLRLSHLHLAGKNPSISFVPEGHQEPKVVALDMETHRALVGWLVNRPDSTGDFLFPGKSSEVMTSEEIQQAVEQAPTVPPSPETRPEVPKPTTLPEPDLSGAAAPPPGGASRPVRPLSRPEMGAPPPGVGPAAASFVPPTAPEEDGPLNSPLPTSAPPPPSRSASPIRPPSGPLSRPEPPPTPTSPTDAVPVPPAKAAGSKEVSDADLTLAGAKKPKPKNKETDADLPAGQPGEEAKVDLSTEKPADKTIAAPSKKETKVEPSRPAKKVEPSRPVERVESPAAIKKDKPTLQQPLGRRSGWSRGLIPGLIGLVLICAVCLVGAWFIGQSETGSQLLASLGLSGDSTPGASTAGEGTEEAVVFESALPTPTLPPTSTPTSLPPTDTVEPTSSATPTSIPATPTPEVTSTSTPTETPEPTDTPEAEEEEPAAAPATPTPGLKYGAPEILDPRDGFDFIQGNTIVLRWKPVDLAPNEQYAVRLVYQYQGQPTYQGANIKEAQWTVPLSLFGLIDGPDNRYEWFVVVERLNDDGSGTAVSPESQRRSFTWK